MSFFNINNILNNLVGGYNPTANYEAPINPTNSLNQNPLLALLGFNNNIDSPYQNPYVNNAQAFNTPGVMFIRLLLQQLLGNRGVNNGPDQGFYPPWHFPRAAEWVNRQPWIPQPVKDGGTAMLLKPAIYLYPEVETIVELKLDNSIDIALDIPKHVPNKGWKVIAHPDGKLIDLQPEETDLSIYDPNTLGMEYLAEVNETGQYPYIYWDGTQTEQPMPANDKGWIVYNDDLQSFFTDKLNEMQFNQAEASEFINFWVPFLQAQKDVTHYHLSFIQNQAVQNYLPLQVLPQPDAYNRIILIAESNPLDSEPELVVTPQVLIPIVRKGFTLVEWGGFTCKWRAALERQLQVGSENLI